MLENPLDLRGASAIGQILRGIEHPGQLADLSGYSPDLKLHQHLAILEERDVVARLEKLLELPWGKKSDTVGTFVASQVPRYRRQCHAGSVTPGERGLITGVLYPSRGLTRFV